jgi:hypothetical protein
MHSKIIALPLALLGGAALVLGAPTAPSDAVQLAGSSGEVCEGWPLIEANGMGKGHFQCSKVPSDVQVRGVFSNGSNTIYTAWFSDTAEHVTDSVSNATTYLTSTESKKASPDNDDADTSNGDCVAIMHEREQTIRNSFSVELRCNRIRSGVKARGVLDLTWQIDTRTNWVSGPLGAPISIESDQVIPSTLQKPGVKVEYELQNGN